MIKPQNTNSEFDFGGINHVALVCSDMQRTVDFYSGGLPVRLAPGLRALAYAQGRQFDVRFESPHAVELDGDSFGLIKRARITVRPGALRVCIGD